MYPYVLSFFLKRKKVMPSILFTMKPSHSKKYFCSLGQIFRATTIEANHSFWQ
jgi:hypothetical protein